MESFPLFYEDAYDKDQWSLRIKGIQPTQVSLKIGVIVFVWMTESSSYLPK